MPDALWATTRIRSPSARAGQLYLRDYLLFEKMAHFNRERIPERVVHAKGSGAHGHFVCTSKEIARYTTAKLFSAVGKKTPTFIRFSTVGGEKGSADTERDPRGFALKFYTEEGNWDMTGNNTPGVFHTRPVEVRRFHPHAKARSRNESEIADDDVGFLVAFAGIAASGDYSFLRPRHTRWLPTYGWLQQPHV